MQDIPAIAEAAHARGAAVIMDNTWSGGVYFKPFAHGVDVSVQSATKYIGGHSDLMMGSITTTEELWTRVRQSAADLGAPSGPDDAYLALRGLRSIKVRMARHQETGLLLALWLRSRPEVARVLHPALPDDPGHAIWSRDFTGASGLFAFVLKRVSEEALAAMLDGLELYGMGASWGGFESLILPAEPIRTATKWQAEGQLLRVHAGLEDPDDLIADLARGFERLSAHG
jgi:cystathionine beta-lyase